MPPKLSEASPIVQQTGDELRPQFLPSEWSELVALIQVGDERGMEQLYKLFGRGIRFYLARHLGPQELEDRLHDTFLTVVKAIQRGDLREPERLMGFVRTVVRRQVAGHIDRAVQTRQNVSDIENGIQIADSRQNPEQTAMRTERAELMRSVLSALSKRHREILVRFYLHEQRQEQICCEMSLTETQFRLLKSRAKAKFGEIGQGRIANNGLFSIFARAKRDSGH